MQTTRLRPAALAVPGLWAVVGAGAALSFVPAADVELAALVGISALVSGIRGLRTD